MGRAVEREGRRDGFLVIRELGGRGIGRTIPEDPRVPNFPHPSAKQTLTAGLVMTVEPIIAAGTGDAVLGSHGWTVRTGDGSPSAHREHTIVITREKPILLTAAKNR